MSHLCDGRDLSCLGCVAVARRHVQVRAAMTLDERLDDIKRAQMWTRIEDRLEAPAKRRTWWPVLALGAAVTGAFAIVVSRSEHTTSPEALVAPADTALSTRLGPHTRASLVGPARLELVGGPGDATSVRLRSGTLLAEFTGRTGRSLRVEAPGAVVEIVGTLFAVEAHETSSCVSVMHGKVRVTSAAGSFAVAGGETWCSDAPQLQSIAPAMRDALHRHELVIAADGTSSGETAPIASAAPGPPPEAAPVPDSPDRAPDPPAGRVAPSRALAAKVVTAPRRAEPIAPSSEPIAPSTAARPAAPPKGDAVPSTGGTTARPAAPPKGDAVPSTGGTTARPAAPPKGDAVPSTGGTTARPAAPPKGDAVPSTGGTTARPAAPPKGDAVPSTAPTAGASPRAEPIAPSTGPTAGASPRAEPIAPSTAAARAEPIAALTAPTAAAPSRTEPIAPSTAPQPRPPAAAVPTADALYQRAEVALDKRDLVAADRALAQLVTTYPDSALLDQALYERARIADQRHAWAEAQRQLDKLAALETTPLAEPGAYLACRVAFEAHDPTAEHRLVEYRKAYPRSPHDLEVIGLLVQLAYRDGGCHRAGPLVDELSRSYRQTTLAKAWRARCKESQ